MADKDNADGKDYRQRLTDQIVESIEKGTAPWQKPWTGEPTRLPFNPVSNAEYRGWNSLWLAFQGRSDPRWCTYKQAQANGWQVKKGERGAVIEYWKHNDRVPMRDETGKAVLDENGKQVYREVALDRPRVFHAVVFNAEQIDGMPELERSAERYKWTPVETAERILAGSKADIRHDQNNRAFYRPATDTIHLPEREQFKDQAGYYSTALHELGHWTGHPDRLNRDLTGRFGTPDYAREELRAELASYFLSSKTGIAHELGQHAAYVQSWVQILKSDKNEIFRAAKDAESITEYVMGFDKAITLEQKADPPKTLTPNYVPPSHTPEHEAMVRQNIRERNETFDYQRLHEQVKVIMGENAQYGVWAGTEAVRGTVIAESKYSFVVRAGNDAVLLGKMDFRELPSIGQTVEIGKRDSDGIRSIKLVEVEQERPATGKEKSPEDVAEKRITLKVPYAEREAAKSAGARWDKDAKSWYAPPGTDMAKIDQWLPKRIAERDPVAEFTDKCREMGLEIKGAAIMDGKIHRVSVVGRQGGRDGAYAGFLDRVPGGFIQNFATAQKVSWRSSQKDLLSPEQREALNKEILEQATAREKAIGVRHTQSSKVAESVWKALPPLADKPCPYAQKKNVPVYGAKIANAGTVRTAVIGDDGKPIVVRFREGDMVIPLRDAKGKLWSYQVVNTTSKLMLSGGLVDGNMHVMGEVKPGANILVAEGYATAATLHKETGHPVVMAVNAGNLSAVVGSLKERHPTNPIYIMGDNDIKPLAPGEIYDEVKHKNPGAIEALRAAHRHNVGVGFPEFPSGTDLLKNTDFNDLAKTSGPAAVKEQVETVLKKTMEQSRQEIMAVAKQQLGVDATVIDAAPTSQHTGKVVGHSALHTAQDVGGRQAVVHKTGNLDALPTPGQKVTVRYTGGRGQVVTHEQKLQRGVER